MSNERRNIVLITFDSLRADRCGFSGYHRDTTPNMDSLASSGIGITNAISPAARTNPSMSGIITGEPICYDGKISNPTHSRSHLNKNRTIAQDLRGEDYTTGAFNPNAYASSYYGFDTGFDHFEDFLFDSSRYQDLFAKHIDDSGIYTLIRNLRNFIRKEEAFRTWETYVGDAANWAKSRDNHFFLWMFSLDTHFPYLTPRSDRRWSSFFDQYYYNWKCNQHLSKRNAEIPQSVLDGISRVYDDSIQYADRMLGVLKEELESEDPIFVIHGDHGEAFGEAGMYGHFYPSLREENVRVPLVIWDSKRDYNQIIEYPVSLLRLPEIIKSLSKGQAPEFPQEPVLGSTFDGRNNRNLVSCELDNHKVILEEDEEGKEIQIERGKREQESVELLLKKADLRLQHEKELGDIRNYAEKITDVDGNTLGSNRDE